MAAIRMTLSGGRFGFAPVAAGWSNVPRLVSVLIRSSMGRQGDSGVREVFCTIAAIGGGAPGRPAAVAVGQGL